MVFQDLSEDNIRSIFSFCDIYAVVAMSRTNIYLHRLTLEKLVWVDLVEDLRRRGFIDGRSRAEIQAQSQEELVGLVKALLTGPKSWTAPALPKAPKALGGTRAPRPAPSHAEIPTQITLHPSGIWSSKKNEAKLIAGGEYVLLNSITLECWSVHDDRLVWAYEKLAGSFVLEFDADIQEGGESATIIVYARSWTGNGTDQGQVHILQLDFRTGISTSLLCNVFLTTDLDDLQCQAVKICGNTACANIRDDTLPSETQSYCILINWETKSHLKLGSNTLGSPFLVNLIPNHILVLTNNRAGFPEIRVINIAAFSDYWQLADSSPFSLPTTDVSDIEAAVCESIIFGSCGRFQGWPRELYAYESPLEAGTYRIWVIISGYSGSPSKKHAVLCSYRLSLMGNGIIWQQRTAANADPTLNCAGITYSGHIRRYNSKSDGYSIFAPGNLDRAVEQILPDSVTYAPVSPYSGALAYATNGALVVSFFKWCVVTLAFLTVIDRSTTGGDDGMRYPRSS
ncbi:hypothetical protein B0H17DRAFT_1066388 [Mycena rosella]|uniref:F-box domain-containing protein n=1 Tax=Mycena rosella TaxID=1033263 RepID=A0AAD7GDD3_MYCRO|nr:hypothetical protein B0H17DRAFT_1066388 [Mycena rosella]